MTQRQVNLDELRRRAEQALADSGAQEAGEGGSLPSDRIRLLVEELHIYQTELEIQNDELRRAQNETASSLAKYRALFESLPLPAVLVDARGFISEANGRARVAFSLHSNALLLHRSAAQLFASTSRERLHALLRQGPASAPRSAPMLQLNGSGEAPQVCDVHALDLAGGEPGADGTLLLFVDRSADIALRRQEERVRKIASHVPGVVYVFQRWPDGRTAFPFVSDGLRALCGLEPAEVATDGAPLFALVDEDDRSKVWGADNPSERRLQPWRAEFRLRHVAGHLAWVEGEASPEPQSDGSVLWYGHLRETTERKKLELSLERANDELATRRDHLEELVAARTAELSVALDATQAASRAKSAFLANMSHELRTPLNGIMGLTMLALRRTGDAKLKDHLAKVQQASRTLLALINDVLDISKIEADRLTLARVAFRLQAVVDEARGLTAPRAAEKGIALHIEVPPPVLDLKVVGDPLRLGQVLLNLLGNAVKFTDRGSVTLRAAIASEDATAVLLRFEIADTGIGIADADLRRLFTAFEQADNSLTRRYRGSGLGLAISRRLVAMMGGEVGVHSRLGEGSTFWFTIRLARTDSAGTAEYGEPPPPFDQSLLARFSGRRVLLAEDEPINQEVARGLLEEVGLVVDVAGDGAAAADLASAADYALILMDVQMPRMNGLEATHAIRRIPGRADTPILAMTANVFADDRRACLESGMNDFIAKPVDPEALFETLLKWLARPR